MLVGVTTTDPTPLLKLLGDPTRLRMLALLERAELSVGELSRALGLAQSRVSNHLRLLREAGLVSERHAGATTFLRRSPSPAPLGPLAPARGAAGAGANGSALASRLWSALGGALSGLPEHEADLVRLEEVQSARRQRAGAFFDGVASQWDKRGVAFATGQARQRAAVHLLPEGLVVADLGCGTGYFARALLGHCARLVCVDQSQGMLDEAAKRLAPVARGTELEFRRGELDSLPIGDGELDAVVAGMVLHHVPELDLPLAEMRRVVRAGGTAVVVELAPHGETWMQAELGDRHLGLAPVDVHQAFQRAGFVDVAVDPIDDRYSPTSPTGSPVELALYAVRGRVPRVSHLTTAGAAGSGAGRP